MSITVDRTKAPQTSGITLPQGNKSGCVVANAANTEEERAAGDCGRRGFTCQVDGGDAVFVMKNEAFKMKNATFN